MGSIMYSAAGDIITVVMCVICWLFLRSTYTTKQINLKLFYTANNAVCIAAICNSFFHWLLQDVQPWNVHYIYLLHHIVYICLALVIVLYNLYLGNLFHLRKESMLKLYWMIIPAFLVAAVSIILSPILKIDFYIDENLQVYYLYAFNLFKCFYVYGCCLCMIMIHKFKKRLVTKTRVCLQCIVCISFLMILLEYIYQSLTFTCISFMLPIMAVLFFFHYNAYEPRIGTLDSKSFDSYIQELKNKPFGMFGLYLKNFPIHEHPEISEQFLPQLEKYFHEYCMFRISDEQMVLIYKKQHNSSDDNLIKNIVARLVELNKIYKIPYKFLYIDSDSKLTTGEDYLKLSNMLMKHISLNTFYRCKETDVDHFIETKDIKTVLSDIYMDNNLDDPRIKVYCQPILDVTTNTYKNAEVLMRIESDGIMFFPDDFIPIAESSGYIHTLSKIILNKTCKYINQLVADGYQFDRISINFSTIDFKDKNFYKEILHIVESNGTPASKLAIEITESEDEVDHKIIYKSVEKLRKNGIVFYLDDFGTGYSNFQRTFTLPVDIIKFDRSITTLACQSPETYGMIKKFSHMLGDFGYKILFEGVETIDEEVRCREMTTHYLQGYNYSEPIEIERLCDYFKKTN